MHAKVENGRIVEYPVLDLRERFPGCSLPSDLTNDAALPEGYVHVAQLAPPDYDWKTQTLVATPPQWVNAKWTIRWSVVNLSESELAQRADSVAQAVRADRDQRLVQCDWTQLSDAPVDKAAWAAYRQALRDVPKQPGFPFAVVWPAQPA